MTKPIFITPVIMSGGAGTRLWPMSRKAAPKQLRALNGERTLLQETALRTAGEAGGAAFAAPIVICNAAHHAEIVRQLREVGIEPGAIVLEPVGRNTAACAAAAAALAAETAPESLLLLLPADHHIHDGEGFKRAIARGAAAARDGKLMTFGIRPTAPETGYGYIRRGEEMDGVYRVAEFVEKPDRETAERYLERGDYSWNAGIFLFRADRMKDEMNRHCPEILTAASAAVRSAERDGVIIGLQETAFGACPANSIDYAVMEKTSHAAVLPMDIGWSDIGSWAALWELAEKDENGVFVHGSNVLSFGARNSYIRTDGPLVAALGVEDLVIVVSNGAVLVAERDEVQGIKDIVSLLRERGREDLL